MNRRLGFILLGAVLFAAPRVLGQFAVPFELRQSEVRNNLASTNGMPISNLTNNATGSNGRAPAPGAITDSNPTGAAGTPRQWQSAIQWSAVARPVNTSRLVPANGYAGNAVALDLPRSTINQRVGIVMVRAQVGSPYLARSITYAIGSMIALPSTDEFGVSLGVVGANNRPIQDPGDYWAPEPYATEAGHTNQAYYWSPHAEAVFANNPGPTQIVWRRRSPSTAPVSRPAGVGQVALNGSTFVIWTNVVMVSGSPAKTPRTIFWTERTFADTGKPILVPAARVSLALVIYNRAIATNVADEVVIPGVVPISDETLRERRTIWVEPTSATAGSYIHAYNVEGRVLLELLGDERSNGSRQHLGMEIVDISQRPDPQDVTVELGDRLTAYGDASIDDAHLTPEPLLQTGLPFTFQHYAPGSSRADYYAIRETVNQNDLQVHWMEEGLQGLKWPARFVRYAQVWPADAARYSHYLRPEVTTQAEAARTAVPLPSENAPVIAYQDALDMPRGFLTETFAYYSWLSVNQPAHRALLRFTAGGSVRFERVFSWLDRGLRNTVPIATRFSSDFATAPAGATLYGTTSISGGVLHLTDAVPGTTGHYVIQDFTGDREVESFRVSLRVRIWDGTTGVDPRGGADGFGVSFGTIPDASYPPFPFLADEGTTNGLVVNFDLWDNGPDDWAPGIVIKTNGVNVAGVAMINAGATPNPNPDTRLLPVPADPATGQPMTLPTGGAYVPVEIVLYRDGRMDVSYKGVKVLQGVQTGYVPRRGRFGLSGRTGGLYSAHWVDDLAITVNEDVLQADPLLAGSVAGHLSAWSTNNTVYWPDASSRPRSVSLAVNVGDRLQAPDGELGGGNDTNYVAGFVRQSQGTLFHPGAYADPFAVGFETAARGAIIPVNAIPGENVLEVWWFRRNQVDLGRGFKPVLWPSVIGRYQLQWPAGAREIVLASNDGSGPLSSLEANGAIYYQNDRTLPGYNPNEEHALMQGGQAFALRDDLNITTTAQGNYSSAPFVLLQYAAADGRPAVRPFRVTRERPDLGLVFDYAVTAGTILQPPMPLPLLEKPLAPVLAGQPPRSLNTEIPDYRVASATELVALPLATYRLNTTTRHYAGPYVPHAVQETNDPGVIRWFFATSVTPTSLSGYVSNLRPLVLGAWTGGAPASANVWRFDSRPVNWPTNVQVVLADPRAGSLWTPTLIGVGTGYVDVDFGGPVPAEAKNATMLVRPVSVTASALAGFRLAAEPLPSSDMTIEQRRLYAGFTLQDRKANTWIYRGPHDNGPGGPQPRLVMQYYYRTLAGFHFPTLPLGGQPPVGTITPYLRARNADGSFEGDPVFGNAQDPAGGDRNPLGVIYRPVWPATAPVLQMAETLTLPKRGLPAVRGQSSLEVAYQQSVASGGLNASSVLLHDPTREKVFFLGAPDNAQGLLDGIPGGVKTQSFQGRTYFPNLPPHLAERLFLDPNRGEHGALVFKGTFVDAALGDRYVFLNVLGTDATGTVGDRVAVINLCPADDPDRAAWEEAIQGLSTTMETFSESANQPGTYVPSDTYVVDVASPAVVTNDDVAVDSYALTAVGPGAGYVSLLAGNGRAFTPEGDPVSVQILRVAKTLYRGEVNIVESSNPLNERLTLQQVIDLAGRPSDYAFQWRIAAPVDGLPPAVYQNTPVTLLGNGVWKHLRHPGAADTVAGLAGVAADRLALDVGSSVAPVSDLDFTALEAVTIGSSDVTRITTATPHRLAGGEKLVVRKSDNTETLVTVRTDPAITANQFHVTPVALLAADGSPAPTVMAPPLTEGTVTQIYERGQEGLPRSVVFREFTRPGNRTHTGYWLSLDLGLDLGARVYLDGQLVVSANLPAGNTPTANAPAGLTPLPRVYALPPAALAGGVTALDGSQTHVIAVELFSDANPGVFVPFDVRLETFEAVDVTSQQWLSLDADRYPEGVRAVLGGSADVRSLSDNYLIMRYQPRSPGHVSYVPDGNGGNAVWSQWTTPQLAEGWIKRVLKGINPFNQRITDLFNNGVNTDVSIVAQAGARWEGDVALNLDSINNAGLIEIYETVLNRGKMLSIGGGINYGPANDALLLAAGYLNDLYMVLGNEAWADAANPTIGIGTKDSTYGEFATSLFAFRGQLPSLLEEELALLRGRDDFLLPGVELRPVYNRMIWNYTRGIDAGEVIYALNYNVLDQNTDGKVDADDARRLYPQGHGDAYGHFLTALKGYYALLMDNNFDWVPRIEAVTVLGKPVSVDYQDERKFAAAAGALARAGKQVFDLTWRRDYQSGTGNGWSHFEATKGNTTTRNLPTTRYWGLDHWAVRAGQGAYLNWLVGNAILPDRDPDPSHTGSIQQVDRTTVPELKELVVLSSSLQTSMDNAEAGLTPLGLPDGAVPFDLNPLSIANGPNSHFEQVSARSREALKNAVTAFDDAKDVTRLMRSEEDSLAEFRTLVSKQELAYTNALIELYGTPYPEDIGPGRTYRTGYAGPDLMHFAYVDEAEITFPALLEPQADKEWIIDVQTFTADWVNDDLIATFDFLSPAFEGGVDGQVQSEDYLSNTNHYIRFNLSSHGFFAKPAEWTGKRASPGRIQQAISDIIQARNEAYTAFYWADAAKYDLDWAIKSFQAKKASHDTIRELETGIVTAEALNSAAQAAYEISDKYLEETKTQINSIVAATTEFIPKVLIAGLAAGGDLTSAARGGALTAGIATRSVTAWSQVIAFSVFKALEVANENINRFIQFNEIQPEEWNQELREATSELRDKVYGMNNHFMTINARLQELDDALRAYRRLVAEGDRIQLERQIFRQRAAAVIQGYRTRDAAFRIFRNEKLERYKALFDLAAQYAFLSAQAYDYDTGLLGTRRGREFINRIVRARALGVVKDGVPQFAGSNTGDPGLSSALAEMAGDWSVVRSRLGFNNPDAYGTTVSLRTENFRILPDTNGTPNWQTVLREARRADLLDDPDVRRYCMQIDPGNGLPVPGLVIEFSTTIADGFNLFGRPLAAWDHAFSSSSFATKIFAVGVALEGYQGMDDPSANGGTVEGSGGTTPGDPDLAFLDPNALSATPYVYLIPVGVDSMRSPPLGDKSVIRTWNVQDVTIPLPFNIGGSDYSGNQYWQSGDSLTEPLFNLRKHQAFRPVSSADIFGSAVIYWTGGELERVAWTNTRLLGRSVWNSKWKLVIPGKTLLSNPDEGLERFIRTVHDIKLYFHTYSYSGN